MFHLQLDTLTRENRLLKQESETLHKNVTELESQLEQQELPSEKYKTEIANLHSQVNILTEANCRLQQDLKDKVG